MGWSTCDVFTSCSGTRTSVLRVINPRKTLPVEPQRATYQLYSDEEVMNAIEIAGLKRAIEGMPLQYETPVGERGLKLSGIWRQY